MTVELGSLYATTILGIAQLLAAAQAATAERGVRWNLSSRETPVQPLGGLAGRLERAFRNLLETFPFFAAAIFIAVSSGRTSWASAMGAAIYAAARLIYVFIYAAGITGVRSVVWLISLAGLFLILLSPLIA